MHDPSGLVAPERLPRRVWPSDVWNAHLADCATPRRCPHNVVLPDWWVGLVTKQGPWSDDHDVNFLEANKRVTRFRGGGDVGPEAAAFTRDAVRDSLYAAPQPLTDAWVSSALSIVGTLASWCVRTAQPLTRDHVFDPSTRLRFLHANPYLSLAESSKKTYRSRLDVVAGALDSALVDLAERPELGDSEPETPLTRQQAAALWVWSTGVYRLRRRRIQAIVVLGLGTGGRRRDLLAVRGRDVTEDEYGVHVTYPPSTGQGAYGSFPERTVTCHHEWEDRLRAVAAACPPDNYLVAPASATPLAGGGFDMLLVRTFKATAPPMRFNCDRLRNTWLLRHMEEGTPLNVLLPNAAMSTLGQIERLIPYLPSADRDTTAEFLRGDLGGDPDGRAPSVDGDR